ncbi:hypothetical protein DFH08DRAFT_118572 [Mycena albidolilacea]|uniref:Uncharacterized protein n=1 Tax=Mycena albidolilacea TaxID=1033008 RepID=A0AAD7A753_9AGAR|nr:hypothetical protein DFH08DRAFT_118572 [Mycena albidolilacea]
MQACLRPFAVRCSSRARLSRSATPTTLTRLGRRNFAAPSEENDTTRDSSSDSADHPAGGSKGLLAAAHEHDTLAGNGTLDEILGPPGPFRPQDFDVELEEIATFNDLRKKHRLRAKQKWDIEGAIKRRESATPSENPALDPSTQPEHESSGSPAPRSARRSSATSAAKSAIFPIIAPGGSASAIIASSPDTDMLHAPLAGSAFAIIASSPDTNMLRALLEALHRRRIARPGARLEGNPSMSKKRSLRGRRRSVPS